MWFKNLRIYRLPHHWAMTVDQLAAYLLTQTYTPLQSLETVTHGWVPPTGADLVHSVNKQMLLTLCTEKKLLPSAVIALATKEKAASIEDMQGFRPGRKQMKEIKEQVTDELLPKAFTTLHHTRIWIDPVNGWLVVDSASPSRADTALKFLIKSIDKLPLETLYVAKSASASMTDWLVADEAPTGFTVDQDAELRHSGEGKATVRYTRHTLEVADLQRHIAAGKRCTRLALTWSDKISFVLDESLCLKRVTPLDVLKENGGDASNEAERFDSDFLLMTGELNMLLGDLLTAFGGEVDRTK